MLLFFYYTMLFMLFASLASFFMLVGSRTVHHQSFIHGRSKCDHCQVTISPLALIPILGYLLTTGKCSNCDQQIPLIYPICEGFFAVFTLLLFQNQSLETSMMLFISFSLLLIMTSADLAVQQIPDRFQAIFLLLVICYILQVPNFPIFTHSIFSLLVVTTFILCNYILHQGIGGGDIKTLAILALLLGPMSFSYLLLLASGLAICHVMYLKIKKTNLPKGLPFLPYLFFAYPIIFYIL
ncbi:prepilin peptidase [Aerococcaceae bacterium 50-4]